MEGLDKMKKDIIDTYEMALALNGDEICKEIDSVLPDDLDLMKVKAYWYCVIYTDKEKNVDSKLYKKFKKYLKHYEFCNKMKNN